MWKKISKETKNITSLASISHPSGLVRLLLAGVSIKRGIVQIFILCHVINIWTKLFKERRKFWSDCVKNWQFNETTGAPSTCPGGRHRSSVLLKLHPKVRGQDANRNRTRKCFFFFFWRTDSSDFPLSKSVRVGDKAVSDFSCFLAPAGTLCLWVSYNDTLANLYMILIMVLGRRSVFCCLSRAKAECVPAQIMSNLVE